MKRLGLLLIGVLAYSGLSAQVLEQTPVDTVTVGSKARYSVDASITPNTTMNASKFDWFFTDNSDVNMNWGGANSITLDEDTVGHSSLFVDNTINVTYATSITSGTTIKVKTKEVSQPKFGAGCEGDAESVNVFFVAVPKAKVTATQGGGCEITSHNVPLEVEGYGPFDVTFTVEYNSSGTPVSYTKTIGAVTNKGGAHSLDLPLTTTELNNSTGVYEVVLTNVVDRFSGKSLSTIAGDVSTTDKTYTVGINEKPTTGTIKHIRNL